MTKKDIDIDDVLSKIKTATPAVLKCSYNFARKLKRKTHRMINPQISLYLSGLKIQPSDRIPDHIVFLCDKKGNTLRMINLTQPPKPPSKSSKSMIMN